MSVSTSFCLLEKLQDHLELCPPQDQAQFCSGAALQPRESIAARKTRCVHAVMVGVLTSVSPAQPREISFSLESQNS